MGKQKKPKSAKPVHSRVNSYDWQRHAFDLYKAGVISMIAAGIHIPPSVQLRHEEKR